MLVPDKTNTNIAKTALVNIFNAGDKCAVLGIFSGSIPSLDPLRAVYAATFTPTCSQILSALGVSESNMLGCVGLPGNTSLWNGTKLTIPLSGMNQLMSAINSGIPSFAIFRLSSTSAKDNTYSEFASTTYPSKELLILTVGDENSTADIQILGGSMVKDQQYRMTDVVITL